MKINAQLIKNAQEALVVSGIVDSQGKYKKEFGGYISSLGAAIVQSGLLPAMIFYESDSEQAKDRKKVINTLVIILNKDRNHYNIRNSIASFLLDNLNNSNFDKNLFLKKVTEAATAMKLALRMNEKGGKDE